MKTSWIVLALVASATAQQLSVQYAAQAIAEKAGFGYEFDKSRAQTDPECRRWVEKLPADTLPFAGAMKQLLDPVQLRYEIENGKVVLYRRDIDLKTVRVNYSTPRASVQMIVQELAKQAGLGYDFDKSFQQTDPDCRRFVEDVSMKDRAFLKAMSEILDPIGLSYSIEGRKVVLYR